MRQYGQFSNIKYIFLINSPTNLNFFLVCMYKLFFNFKKFFVHCLVCFAITYTTHYRLVHNTICYINLFTEYVINKQPAFLISVDQNFYFPCIFDNFDMYTFSGREETLGCLLHQFPKFYNNDFFFVGLNFGYYYFYLLCWFISKRFNH